MQYREQIRIEECRSSGNDLSALSLSEVCKSTIFNLMSSRHGGHEILRGMHAQFFLSHVGVL